jgi:hypothetical protein
MIYRHRQERHGVALLISLLLLIGAYLVAYSLYGA